MSVGIASVLGQMGFRESAAYVVAKHGVVGLTKRVAELVTWLASPKASFVTGTYLAVDGGYLAQ